MNEVSVHSCRVHRSLWISHVLTKMPCVLSDTLEAFPFFLNISKGDLQWTFLSLQCYVMVSGCFFSAFVGFLLTLMEQLIQWLLTNLTAISLKSVPFLKKFTSLKTFPSNSRVTFLSLTSLQCFIVNSNKLKQKKFLLELFIEFLSLFLDLLFQNKDIKQILPELYFRCGRVCHPGQNSLPTANVIDWQ